MLRIGRWMTLGLGIAVVAGCNRQDADALAKIGQIVVERAKSLPELKSPAAKEKPQSEEEKPKANADESG